MNISWIWKRYINILLFPNAEYINIKKEKKSTVKVLLLTLIVCLLVGLSYIYAGLSNVFYEAFIWLLTSVLSSCILLLIAYKFAIPILRISFIHVLLYSLFPFLTCLLLGNSIGYRGIFFLIGTIYSFYLFYIGLKIVFNFKTKRIVYCTSIALLSIISANYMLRVLIP